MAKKKSPVPPADDVGAGDLATTATAVKTCRDCGCTEEHCEQCIEKTGSPCSWVEGEEPPLCTACVAQPSAAPHIAEGLVVQIPLADITPSTSNPRRTRDKVKDAELADSIRRVGLLQPVLCRPLLEADQPGDPNTFELVIGRRRFDAAKVAGLTEISATVRELTDLQALEVQIIENTQREDVHPLEEADGYRTLHEVHGLDVDTIAAKVGKSRAAIYARLKLCELCPSARKLFLEDGLTASTALLVARIPDPKQQAEAAKDLSDGHGDGPMPYRSAVQHVHRNFMLELKTAPFDTRDADLLPAAGACGPCPKRSGNASDLFGDVTDKNVCTDSACFQLKVNAAWARQREEAVAAGRTVLEGKKADAFAPHGRIPSTHVRLDATCYEDPKKRTYGALMGKEAPATTLVRIRDGYITQAERKTVEVVTKGAFKAALKVRGIKLRQPSSSGIRSSSSDAAFRAKRERERAVSNEIIKALLEKPSAVLTDDQAGWRFLAGWAFEQTYNQEIASRRYPGTEGKPRRGMSSTYAASRKLETWIEQEASAEDCRGLVLELIASTTPDLLKEACRRAAVNETLIRARVTKELATSQKAVSKPASKSKSQVKGRPAKGKLKGKAKAPAAA